MRIEGILSLLVSQLSLPSGDNLLVIKSCCRVNVCHLTSQEF